jgi:hypothetical protein
MLHAFRSDTENVVYSRKNVTRLYPEDEGSMFFLKSRKMFGMALETKRNPEIANFFRVNSLL